MSEWFRSKHGAPFDPKWGLIAKKAKTSRAVVVSIAWCLMDIASQATERGDVSGADPEELAVALDISEDEVLAVIEAMHHKDRFIDQNGRIPSWGRHQPKWEGESSTDRVRKHREEKKKALTHGNITENGETLKHVSSVSETSETVKHCRTEKRRTESSPLPPLGDDAAKNDSVDEIRKSVWKRQGLSDEQVATKLASASSEGVSQVVTWLKSGLGANRILAAIDRGYAEAREPIRRPWVYLAEVMKTEIENPTPCAPMISTQDDLWRNRVGKAWVTDGRWQSTWNYPPDHPQTEVPDHILAEFGLARKGTAA